MPKQNRRATVELEAGIVQSTDRVRRSEIEVDNLRFEVRCSFLSDAVWYNSVSDDLVSRQFNKTVLFFLQ